MIAKLIQCVPALGAAFFIQFSNRAFNDNRAISLRHR